MERCILFVEDDANFRGVFTRRLREALTNEQLDVSSLRLALQLRPVRGLGRVGWTPHSSTSPCPTATGWTSWQRSTTVAQGPHPDPCVDGEPGDLRGWPRDGGGREGSAFQAGFDARDRRCDKEANGRRTLRGMSTPRNEWGSVSSLPARWPSRVNAFQRPVCESALLTPCLRREGLLCVSYTASSSRSSPSAGEWASSGRAAR